MKTLGISLAALLAGLAAAQAADLPTKKSPPPPPAVNCFSSLYAYFDSTPADCPLTYGPLTAYGVVDFGVGYETHGTPFNYDYHTGVEELISKNSQGGMWEVTPGGLSQSQVGLRLNQPVEYGWSVVGAVALGFDPYDLHLSNGPYSMAQNTNLPLQDQSSNGDSSRAGQWDNSVGYAGISNKTYGTLTVGRQNTFGLDAVNTYDPMGGSYAFSVIGYSGKTAGAGGTEDARANTSVKYTDSISNFRFGGLWQFGGYTMGNGEDAEYQGDAGVDINNFSMDVIYTYIQDQVNLGTYNGPLPKGVPWDALTATLSDNNSVMAAAKYTWGPAKLFGGFEWIRYTNPTDPHSAGFYSIGGQPVPSVALKGVNDTKYTNPSDFYIYWTGVKYAITDRLDITGAYYGYYQPDFNTTPCTVNKTAPAPGYSPHGSSSSACAGNLNAVSAMIDYRPLKRIDLYAGLMYSEVSGGLANGYLNTSNLDPTVGVRIQF